MEHLIIQLKHIRTEILPNSRFESRDKTVSYKENNGAMKSCKGGWHFERWLKIKSGLILKKIFFFSSRTEK